MKAQKPVSEKSTKQEILDAYQEVIDKLEDKPVSEPILSSLQKMNKLTSSSFNDLLDQMNVKQSEMVRNLQSQIDEIMKMFLMLREKAENQKRILDEEEKQKTKERARQEEEYNYEFERKRKRQEDDLREIRQKIESELTVRKESIQAQETEFIELKNLAKTFEPRLEKGIREAVEKSTKELKVQSEHEKALFLSQTNATQTLLEQRISLLEKTIEDQKQEIIRLNQTSKTAVDQMTRIAERAVTKAPDIQPISPAASNK